MKNKNFLELCDILAFFLSAAFRGSASNFIRWMPLLNWFYEVILIRIRQHAILFDMRWQSFGLFFISCRNCMAVASALFAGYRGIVSNKNGRKKKLKTNQKFQSYFFIRLSSAMFAFWQKKTITATFREWRQTCIYIIDFESNKNEAFLSTMKVKRRQTIEIIFNLKKTQRINRQFLVKNINWAHKSRSHEN